MDCILVKYKIVGLSLFFKFTSFFILCHILQNCVCLSERYFINEDTLVKPVSH